jgi:hypothetical protein
MPTLLDAPPREDVNPPAAQTLRSCMAAVRLSFTWLGVRRTLTHEQRSQAADTFGAEEDYLSAAKKLLDTSHPAFRAVTAVRSKIVNLWRSRSLPYPEPGIRLIRREDVESWTAELTSLQILLADRVYELDQCYAELTAAASQRLGQLFNSADYPPSLTGMFAVSCDFPNVEPPEYLARLCPRLYQEEAIRVAARFQEAVDLAEQAFIDELAKMVSHLTERLSGTEDGKPKVFRDSAIENLQAFFERFRQLNVRSSSQLDQLVTQVQEVTRGVTPLALRNRPPLRQEVATQLAGVQAVLDGLLVDRPRRMLVRRGRSGE